MNLGPSVMLIVAVLFGIIFNIFPILSYYLWLKLLMVSIAVSALISRLFFMKDGFILVIKNVLPRIIGRRKENSKWEQYFRVFESIGIALRVITLFILLFDSETVRLRQKFGVEK